MQLERADSQASHGASEQPQQYQQGYALKQCTLPLQFCHFVFSTQNLLPNLF
jgi:hypothetical protein